MKTTRSLLSLAAVAGLLATTVFAQFGGMGPRSSPGLDPVMARIFGSVKGFSARSVTIVSDQTRGGAMTMASVYEMLEGKMRMEIDMAGMQGPQMRPEAVAQMRMMGMDRMVMIVRPDRHLMYMLYPGLKAYAEMPLPPAAVAVDAAKPSKIELAEIGRERIDGHPCVKNRMSIDLGGGKKREGLIWNATDLKNFPLQVQFDEAATRVTMQFKDVRLQAPPAGHFDPPADYKRYGSIQEMMMSAAQRMMGEGGMPGMPAGRRSP